MMSPDTANLRAWPLLLPGLLGVAIYWPTLQYGFVFDDLSLIAEDGPVRLGTTWLAYRPMRHLSYLFDYQVGGGAAWAYHLTNVILHGANASLVAALAVRLGAGLIAAVVAGMLFVAHPIGVEAAAYVAGRRDLLALLFSLLSVLLWISARSRPSRAALALLAILAATLSKESGVCAAALCGLASVCGLGPRLALGLASLAITAGVSISAALLYGAVGPLWVSGDPAAAVRIAGALSAHYATSLVMPVGLSVDYPQLICSGVGCANLGGQAALLGVALLVALLAVATILISRTGMASPRARNTAFSVAGVALLFVTITASIGGHEPGADRHAYPLLALLALTFALVGEGCLFWLRSDAGRRVALTLALILVALGVRMSEARMTVWESPWTLWGAAVAQPHVSARAHHNMGRLLAEDGNYRQARQHFRDALIADRWFSPSVVALASLECERGYYRRAMHALDRARELGAADTEVARVRQACDTQRDAG